MICGLQHVAGDNAFRSRIFFHRRQSTANNVFVHPCALISSRLWPVITIVTRDEILNQNRT